MSTEIKDLIKIIDSQRSNRGFLTIAQVLELTKRENVIIDAFSTCISAKAEIGSGNIFYPNSVIEQVNDGEIIIGDKNVFYSNTFLIADKGKIAIGNENQFGDGGVSLKANTLNSLIKIGNNGRYINGVQVIGNTTLGSGTQLIGGLLTVQDCTLEDGESYVFQDPDSRGALLKGIGVAKQLTIPRGKVIQGNGIFLLKDLKDQSFFHKNK